MITLLKGCNVLDVRTGGCAENVCVLIRKSLIEGVGKLHELDVPEDTQILEADGLWVMPGLFDVHVHLCHEGSPSLAREFDHLEPDEFAILRAARNMLTAATAGVTVLRDVGTFKARGIRIRNAVRKGIFRGPRVVSCGHLLTSKKAHAHEIGIELEGVDQIRSGVHEQVELDADFIKVTNDPVGFSLSDLKVLVEEAHTYGKKVACHAFTRESVQIALDAQVDTIEHAVPFDDSMLEQMNTQETVIVPTFYCARQTCLDVRRSVIDAKDLPMFQAWLDGLESNLPRAIAGGVRIATGTDAGYPPLGFSDVVEEIRALADVGATPLQALQCATTTSAEACGLEGRYGSVEPGMTASLVAVPGNPAENLDFLRDVRLVFADGELVFCRC